jgi:hypothetical protein
MSEKSRRRSPWLLNYLVFGGVLIFYYFLVRPAEPVNDLEIVGDLAYMTLGRVGLVIVDVTNAVDPNQIGSFDTLGIAQAVSVKGHYAYIADGREGLRIIDIDEPRSPREVGAYDTPGFAEDVDVQGNLAYVADGSSGLIIIDVDEKENPRLLGPQSIYKTNGSIQVVVVQENIAYLGDNQNNFRLLSISNPKQPEEIAVLNVEANIENIDIKADRAYLATGEQGLVVVDIANPTQPTVLQTINTAGTVQDVVVNDGIIAFLADGTNGLLVWDISDLNAVENVGSYSNLIFANQVALDDDRLYVADKDSALHVVDADIELGIRRVTSTEQQQGNAQNVAVRGDLAYVTYANQGLRLIDVTIPEDAKEVTAYDSPGDAVGVTLSGDFIYLADGSSGLRVLFLESPDSDNPQIQEISAIDTPGEVSAVALVGQLAYLADGSGGLRIISLVNPAEPGEVGWEDTPGNAIGVAVLGDYAYVADGDAGLRVINVLDPTKPAEVGAYDTPGEARAVMVRRFSGPPERILAYIADGEGGLRVIEVTDPRNPQEIGFFTSYENVLDVFVLNDNAYLAADNLGLRIVNVADPALITEVGSYDTPGEAYGLDLKGQYTYIADNTRGLRIVDVSNPAAPIEAGFYDVPRVVRRVDVSGEYAYLADITSGFRIADVSNPRKLRQVGHYDEGGIVEDIVIQSGVAYLADEIGLQTVDVSDVRNPASLGSFGTPGSATAVFVVDNIAYVTDNEFGLSIVEVSDPETIQFISLHPSQGEAQDIFVAGNYAYIADGPAGLQIVNIADLNNPQTASVIDQFQNATSVVVIGDYAYLADGPNGIWVIDVSKPVTPETIAFLDTPGTALDLEYFGVYLFVADGDQGVQVVYILNPFNPTIVGGMELEGLSLDLDVEWRPGKDGGSGNFFTYVAKRERGLEILGAEKRVVAVVTGLYETPGMAPLKQVMRDQVFIFGGTGTEKSARTVRQTFFDIIVIGGIGLLIWLAFFAQFLLPLSSLRDRWAAFQRTLLYMLKSHGPAVRVENGRIKQRLGEEKRRGPGVILLDSASAAMLRTKTRFKQAIGPGVIFTEDGEFLHPEAIDLHIQKSPKLPLGPFPGEDPFGGRARGEDEEEYKARQNRRKETSGITRDGVEVVTNILAVVKTKSMSGQGGTRFGFNSQSVRKAITREGVVPNGLKNVPWYEVPAFLAVDVWREYLGKFTLTELFSDPSENGDQPQITSGNDDFGAWKKSRQTKLGIILSMVNMRMTQPIVPRLDEYGNFSSEMQESREFQLLEEMGIKVEKASVSGIKFPRTVESQIVYQWLSTWLQRANLERKVIERKRILAGESGKDTALLDFAEGSVRILSEALVDDGGKELPSESKLRPNLRTSLEMLVAGTLQLLTRNTKIQEWLTDEEEQLMDILEWTRR